MTSGLSRQDTCTHVDTSGGNSVDDAHVSVVIAKARHTTKMVAVNKATKIGLRSSDISLDYVKK